MPTGAFKKLKGERGGIGVFVLAAVLCAAVCLHAAAWLARQEAEENHRWLLTRQLQFAAQALVKAAAREDALPDGEITLPVQKLYPGGYDLQAKLTVQNAVCGVRRVYAIASAGGETIALQQLCYTLPQDVLELAGAYTLAAGKTLAGAQNLSGGSSAGNLGNILNSVDVKDFKEFYEFAYLTKTQFEEHGLSGALYYDEGASSKSIDSASKVIKGSGLLVSLPSVFIADGVQLPGFCIIISDGQIEVGKNAVLGSALLLAKYNITVKSGAKVSGIALCDGNLTVEDGAQFTRSESVLRPFAVAVRVKQK